MDTKPWPPDRRNCARTRWSFWIEWGAVWAIRLEGQKEMAEMAEAPETGRQRNGRGAAATAKRIRTRRIAARTARPAKAARGRCDLSRGAGGVWKSERAVAAAAAISASHRNLPVLFELELDKMKNQYETVQRQQRQQAQQAKSEAERKLEELARRQEQALEEQRRRHAGQPAIKRIERWRKSTTAAGVDRRDAARGA